MVSFGWPGTRRALYGGSLVSDASFRSGGARYGGSCAAPGVFTGGLLLDGLMDTADGVFRRAAVSANWRS